jgi:DeoR family glycerol-3-phosphate regulon repressor
MAEASASLDRPRPTKSERQEHIVAELRATPTLRVSELAAELDVSTETIRRDLDELEERGLINRTYGGAVRPLSVEPALSERHQLMVREREAIAAAAAKLVRPNDVVAIGGGATTLHVARRMAAECRDVTVITHSFGVATVLAANPTILVLVCPGRYVGREGFVVGPETIDYVQSYHANRAILGATGLTAEGANDADATSALVYRALMKRAAETIVVADHTKFDQPALAMWGRWADIAALVTDRAPTGPLARALERARVEVTVAAPRG